MGWILTAAAAASAFNLVCVGNETTGIGSGKPKDAKTIERVYRVDLDSRRYCSGDCTSTYPMASIEPHKLYLARDPIDQPIGNYIVVNREDGVIAATFKMADFHIEFFGKCEPAPFSGFPARKF